MQSRLPPYSSRWLCSHQYVRQGYKVMHGGRLVTLFSARNYFTGDGGVSNDSALLLLAADGNGHLRMYPKRLAHLAPRREGDGGGDWRVGMLSCLAKCMGIPEGTPML